MQKDGYFSLGQSSCMVLSKRYPPIKDSPGFTFDNVNPGEKCSILHRRNL